MAAIHSMVHRMISMPLNRVRYEAEKKRIIEIGQINGYPSSTITHIIDKHELKKQRIEASILFESAESEDNKRVVIPFLKHTNSEMSKVYKDADIQMVNNNVSSVQKLIGNAKDKIPSLLKAGVYEVKCNDPCPFKYYGVTERNPAVRYDEHDYCVIKRDKKSAVAKHMIEYEHETSISNVKLIQPVSGRNTCAFECYEKIHIVKNRRSERLMNLNDGNLNSILFDLV